MQKPMGLAFFATSQTCYIRWARHSRLFQTSLFLVKQPRVCTKL